MTPEQEALVAQVLEDVEMTEHLLSQPRFTPLWRMHAWAFADHMDLQLHITDKSKRTSSGWPPQLENNIDGYIKSRVRELQPAQSSTVPINGSPPVADKHIERLHALINGGEEE